MSGADAEAARGGEWSRWKRGWGTRLIGGVLVFLALGEIFGWPGYMLVAGAWLLLRRD